MGKRLTVILGGARSGKSSYAERLAATHGTHVLYIATAQAWDNEMTERIANHRAQRPATWQTVEAPIKVGEAIDTALQNQPQIDLVLVDCLTLLASNLLITLPDDATETSAMAILMPEIDALLESYNRCAGEFIVISNEVGLGIVPPYPLGRLYRDALGRANQQLAAIADEVIFMVAGLPMVLKGKEE